MPEQIPNLWMLRFNDKYEFSIVENIIKKDINVSLILGNFQTYELLDKFKSQHSVDIEFIDSNAVMALDLNLEDNIKPENYISNFFNKDLYKRFYTTMQVMERNERYSGELSFEERNYIIYKQVEFWQKKIEEKKPTSLIFFDVPHQYYEQIILAICDEKNIPCLFMSNSRNNTLFINNKHQLVSGYGGKKFSEVNNEYFNEVKKNLNSPSKFKHISKKPVSIKDLLIQFLKIPYHFLMNRKKIYKRGHFIKKNFFNFGYNSTFNQSINLFLYNWNCIKLKRLYNNISCKADFESDFVYMPLVGGFECTLHPVSSPLNYFIILDYLHSILPKNCYIYVKEHHAQFLFRYHQRFARSKEFYSKVKEMKKVRFIDINENHYKLIAKSKFVVGSSASSTAIESVALKKIYKYYGFPRDASKYIEPLFNIGDKNISTNDTNAYHLESKYRNLESDPSTLASKIIMWSKDNL